MKTSAALRQRNPVVAAAVEAPIEQLTLLPTSNTPARFRLSRETRERGLRHVAEIRQMLTARAEATGVQQPRHDRAA
jgi:hypothetical protein